MRLTGLHLKIITLITMSISHLTYILPISQTISELIMINIGRITFPIIGFLLVEGYHHTKNKITYMYRMILPALLASYPFYQIINHKEGFLIYNNIMFTLLISLIMLYLIDKYPKYQLIIIIISCMMTIPLDWGVIGPLVIYGFYKIRNPHITIILLFILFYGLSKGTIDEFTHFGILVSIPLLYIYNGKRGFSSRKIQNFIYFYYPLHLWILWIISYFIS